MSMITELVEKLRHYAEIEDDNFLMGYRKFGIVQNLLRQASIVIEELSAKVAQQNMEKSIQYYNCGWIPCEGKLPDDDAIVLCQDSSGEMSVGIVYKNSICFSGFAAKSDHGLMFECVAWQPFPTAYRSKED